MGLARAADMMKLPAKQGNDDYSVYTSCHLDRPAISYAVRDVILPEIIRHAFAPAGGFAKVIRCG